MDSGEQWDSDLGLYYLGVLCLAKMRSGCKKDLVLDIGGSLGEYFLLEMGDTRCHGRLRMLC